MRKYSENGVTIKYMDEVAFAFNPCLVVAEGKGVEALDIVMDNGTFTQSFIVEAFKDKCYADMRAYIQRFFDEGEFGKIDYKKESQLSALGEGVELDISTKNYRDDNTAYLHDYTVFMWGALKAGGEEFNFNRRLTMFKGYPFSVDVYVSGKCNLSVDTERSHVKDIALPGVGLYTIPLGCHYDGTDYCVLSTSGSVLVGGTYDNTFDYTFKYTRLGGSDGIRIDFKDGCDDGYYLRWIDRHGHYCYYLFEVAEGQIRSASENVIQRNNLLSYDIKYGFRGAAGIRQRMSREDHVTLCAPLVDIDTWDMLCDIATSPIVDLFKGYDDGNAQWLSVSVGSGSYQRGQSALQDFVFVLVMPEVIIQKL